MFEHLDTTDPPSVEAWFDPVVARAGRLRRRRRAAGAATLALAVALPAVGVAAAWRRLQPERVHVVDDAPGLLPAPGTLPGPTPRSPADATTAAAAAIDRPITLVVVGTDRALPGRDGPLGADTIAVVRIDPAGSRRILLVPRDLRVPGADVRIGSLVEDRVAFVRALADLVHLPVDHYVELDTDGFAGLVDAVGGVRMALGRPVRDVPSGFGTDGACETFDGAAVTAYLRSRYMEWWDGAAWQPDRTGDTGRMVRAQRLVGELLSEVLRGGRVDPLDLVTRVLPRATVDDRLSLGEARRVAGAAREVTEPWEIQRMRTTAVRVGEAEMWDEAAAGSAARFLGRDATPEPVASGPPDPTTFDVIVPMGICP